jgi:hypothetical protein
MWTVLLPPLIIIVIIGLMIGWEIGIASGSLAGLVICFVQASLPNASSLYAIAGIVLAVLFFLTAGDSLRRIINREKLKACLLALTKLYQQGDLLRLDAFNEVKNDSQKNLWWPKVVSWKDEVCSIMNKIRSGDADNWLSLNKYIPRHNLYNNDMSNKADSISAWVDKLRNYIESKGGNEPKVD